MQLVLEIHDWEYNTIFQKVQPFEQIESKQIVQETWGTIIYTVVLR